MEKKIKAICILSEELVLGLSDIRKNTGHDDSLPYQAEVHILDRTKNPFPATELKGYGKVGTICNSGWGGDSELRADFTTGKGRENLDYLEKARSLCASHQMYYDERPFGAYSVEDVCDIIAECAIFGTGHKGKTLVYRFDDDPAVLADARHRNFQILR